MFACYTGPVAAHWTLAINLFLLSYPLFVVVLVNMFNKPLGQDEPEHVWKVLIIDVSGVISQIRRFKDVPYADSAFLLEIFIAEPENSWFGFGCIVLK